MNTTCSGSTNTRQRILEQACRIFAEKGFREATVSEICTAANANIAAVNYHFRSKGALYVEAWRFSLERSLEKYPSDGGVPPDATAEERLRGRIFSIMQRIADPESHVFDIAHKEMANPTGLLTDVMHESLEPLRREMASMIHELLGRKATPQQVRLCQMSITAQCFGPLLRERRRRKFPQTSHACRHEPLRYDVETLADHVTRFSLAGIREISHGAPESRRSGNSSK